MNSEFTPARPVFTAILNLPSGRKKSTLNVKGTVIEIASTREVASRWDGRLYRVAKAVIRDDTDTIPFSLWNTQIELVQVGDTVELTDVYVSVFRGVKQLNIKRSGTITVVGR